MKKFLSVLSVFCFTLFAGVFLVACGEKSNYNITTTMTEGTSYVEVVLQQDGETLTKDDSGKYVVERGANVKALINATQSGVDMSELSVKVNNVEKPVFENSNYDPFEYGGDLNYGYFLISNVNKDINISLSGDKFITTKFTFEVNNIEDPEVITKLQMTSICLNFDDLTEEVIPPETEDPATEPEEPKEPEYINFYDYLTSGEDLSFEREFDDSFATLNRYRTFRIKFDGVAPFDLEENFPFKIEDASGKLSDIASMMNIEDYYIVDMGIAGLEKEYKIVVDFSDVKYKSYNIYVPTNNMTYSIETSTQSLSFDQEGTLTLTKNLDADKVDYTNLKVFINNLELQAIEGSETTNTIQYAIPKGITPLSTGGLNVLTVSVSGIEYLVPSYKIFANSVEPYIEEQFIMPEIFAVNDEGEDIGLVGVGSDGGALTLEGQKNAIIWSYDYDEINQAYYSLYDLYDYSLYANAEKVFNIKEAIDGATQDLTVELGNNNVFKAFYNEETKTFDSFQFEFYCTEDTIFEFRDFVIFSKNIHISYEFVDSRIENVEYAITHTEDTSMASWAQLDSEGRSLAVYGSDVVAFRLTTVRDEIGAHEFKIENSKISNTWYNSESYEQNGYRYTILKFVVSRIQYDGVMEFKLVPSGVML